MLSKKVCAKISVIEKVNDLQACYRPLSLKKNLLSESNQCVGENLKCMPSIPNIYKKFIELFLSREYWIILHTVLSPTFSKEKSVIGDESVFWETCKLGKYIIDRKFYKKSFYRIISLENTELSYTFPMRNWFFWKYCL